MLIRSCTTLVCKRSVSETGTKKEIAIHYDQGHEWLICTRKDEPGSYYLTDQDFIKTDLNVWRKEEKAYAEYNGTKRIGGKEKTRTEIIQEAINELYYKMINKTMDADVVGRISMTVDDRVSASMNNLQSKIDQILYLVNKLDLRTKVLYRSPSVLPPPKSVEQAINIIVKERSDWYSAIEEHTMSKLMKDNEKECE